MLSINKVKELKRFVILPLLIAFMTIVLLFFGRPEFTVASEKRISLIESGWSIFRGMDHYKDVNLAEFDIGNSNKSETIITKNTIDVKNDGSAIMFVSKLSTVDVYLDDELIYTYGREYLKEGKFVPKKNNIIPLNTVPGEHELLITYTFSENNSIKRFVPIFLGQKGDLIRTFYSHHRVSIFIGAFLIIYALLFFSLWIYLMLSRGNAAQVMIGALFSLLMGCYIFGRNDIFCFIGNHEMLFSMIEYLSFYLMPLAFSILIYSIHDNDIRMKLTGITLINIVFPIIILMLHFGRIVHINRFLNTVGILDVIEIIIILPFLILNVISHQKEKAKADVNVGVDAEIYLFIGFIIMAIMTLAEIGIKPTVKDSENIAHTGIFSTINFLELGMLFFIMCHFIYYFVNSINHMSANRIKSQLEGLAYNDALTGLKNRAALNEFYGTLTGSYGIVSIDLDRLKEVNDTLGHITGDKMIKAFADILTMAYASANIVARTGGDEFIVVFKNPDEEICQTCVNQMNNEIEVFNQGNEEFKLSASVGYAFSYEVKSGRYQDVFYLADQRMYQMKEAHHG